MDLPEPAETNDLMCVMLRKSNSIDRIPNDKLEKGDLIPEKGDGYYVGDVSCTVVGHAYTPHLRYTWHLFLTEN